jgi:carboxymethylenebutenolidase
VPEGMTPRDPLDLSELRPWQVEYPSRDLRLQGFLFVPEGEGPFPGIVFNHGSEGLMHAARNSAEALVGRGYAVLLAVRRGFNGNPGRNYNDYLTASPYSPEWGRQMVEGLHAENDDVMAAMTWFRQLPMVDTGRIAQMGVSFGGVMVMMAGSRSNEFRAGVSFAGPSITWPRLPELEHAVRSAVERVTVPLFLLQAHNDNSLEPIYTLGLDLFRRGKPHEVRVYGNVGTTPDEGHYMVHGAVDLWLADVDRFLRRWGMS